MTPDRRRGRRIQGSGTAYLGRVRREATGGRGNRVGLDRFVAGAGAVGALAVPMSGILYGIIRVGYEEYYRGLGLTPDDVGLSQAAIVSGVAVVMGTLLALVATWVAFGVVIYRLMAPMRAADAQAERTWSDWFRLLLAVLIGFSVAFAPLAAAVALGAGRSFFMWATGALYAGVIGVELCWLFAVEIRDVMRRAWRFLYPRSQPKVALLLGATIVGGVVVVSVLGFWDASAAGGRAVHDTGRRPAGLFLQVLTSPARVIPKGDDPLKVCGGDRRAVLVGRHDGVSYVLLLPEKGPGPPSEVVPLSDADYAVATATIAQPTCGPAPPTP
jgi:hypothetical protein